MTAPTVFSILVICIVLANTTANRLTDGSLPNGDYGNDDDTLRQQMEQNKNRIQQLEAREEEMHQQLAGHQQKLQELIEGHQRELHVQKQEQIDMLLMRKKVDNLDRAIHNISKREIASDAYPIEYAEELLNLLIESGQTGPPGKDGKDCEPCKDGEDGEDGDDGENGTNGSDGIDGERGPQGPQGLPGANNTADVNAGAVYTRWGRTTCPSHSTLVYEGFAGSPHANTSGGGINYQCMPQEKPEYDDITSEEDKDWWGTYMAGTQYEVLDDEVHNQNAPCARCYTRNRAALMMMPARKNCPDGWTKEYEGYLMTERDAHAHPSTFECVDSEPEYITGEAGDNSGSSFNFVRTVCTDYGDTGHCPPYNDEQDLTCVVCTQ